MSKLFHKFVCRKSAHSLVGSLKKNKRKFLLAVILTVILLLGLRINAQRETATETPKPSQKTASVAPQRDYIRLIASGDTIAHDALNAAAKQANGTYDYYQFMQPLQKYFDGADIRFCNQAVPGGGTKFGIKGYPVFNSPLEVAHDLHKLGCNVVNTGTNHTFDMGQTVIDAELNDWDTLPHMLAVAGANRSQAEQDTIRYFEVKGVRFAFLSYSTYSNTVPPNTFGLNMFSEAKAKKQVTTARSKADIVLVSMRWGTEYSSSTNTEQDRISQLLADWGSDIVIGHGSHVVQPVRQLSGPGGRPTLVWYSIGNFLNAQIPVESLVSGLPVLDIDIKTKTLKPPKYLPIYMHYEWTADEKAREDLLKRHAFTMVPLSQAKDLLARSQNNTTVEAQTERIKNTLNRFTPVTIIDAEQY